MNIAILGAGAWGSALASSLAQHHRVTLWGRELSVMDGLRDTGINQQFLPNIKLHPSLQYNANLNETLSAHASAQDLIIIATPISGLNETIQKISQHKTLASILWLCKGIERETRLFPHQIIANTLTRHQNFGVLSGPSFAQEVAIGQPCALVMASASPQLDLAFVQTLTHSRLRIYHSTDVIGVELGGAHKNVLAIAAGIADGLNLGLNARAALLTRGIAEMRRFAHALGASPDTIVGLTGVGDLILTATGDLSRNRSVGLQLAQGKPLDKITAELGHVAEGALCAHAMLELAQLHQIRAPITHGVCAVLDGVAPQTVLEQLLLREAISE